MIKIVCILGATGSGKTGLAIKIAKQNNGAVINFDSRQIYEDIPIITAQPNFEEKASCPHHLYGFMSCISKISAGEFCDIAFAKIKEVSKLGFLPILVGGSGLYIRALLEGLVKIPKISHEINCKIVEDLHLNGLGKLYNDLKSCDVDYANKIKSADTQRIMRALEVYLQTGKPLSWWHKQDKISYPLDAYKIGLDFSLEKLTPFLEARINLMLENGALEEMRTALQKYKNPNIPGFTGIGCPELIKFIQDEISFEELKILWSRNTRAYAKRQFTWFRKEKNMNWVLPDCEQISDKIAIWVK